MSEKENKKTIKKYLNLSLLKIIILTFYKVQKQEATCLLQLKSQLCHSSIVTYNLYKTIFRENKK